MSEDKTNTNISFDYLKGSSEFMTIILNNINSCILLLNSKMELQAYNNAFKTIFTNRKNEDLLYVRCGEAIGCAYTIEEQSKCGNTSQCRFCELRLAALESYSNGTPIFKEHIVRPYFNDKNEKIEKHLQFSTRLFIFKNEKYIIMIVEDITRIYAKAM